MMERGVNIWIRYDGADDARIGGVSNGHHETMRTTAAAPAGARV
jgi:hypothetical protein